jgi:hypothetical protein
MNASPGSCLRAYDAGGFRAQLSAPLPHPIGRGGVVKQTLRLIIAVLGVLAVIAIPVAAQVQPQLDAGFNNLYKLKFDEARTEFSAYELTHPDDPVGEAAQAASYLFEEFNAQGVLTSEFFLNDKKFLGGVDHPADPQRRAAFLASVVRSRAMAAQRLKTDPRDVDGLFAVTLLDGMESDFDAIIEKKQLESVHKIKDSEADAARLLAVKPDALDAYVALGAANYIIGSLPGYKRAFLWFGGVHGDRVRGMAQLAQAAEHGGYLQAFAKVMLALASLREHQPERARILFAELHRDFPENPVFTRELARLDK